MLTIKKIDPKQIIFNFLPIFIFSLDIIFFSFPCFGTQIMDTETIQPYLLSADDFSNQMNPNVSKMTIVSLAEERLKQGQFKIAYEYASAIIKNDPQNFSTNGVLGVIFAFTGQKNNAIEILAFFKKHPDQIFYTQLIRAILNAQEGKIKLAQSQLKKCIEAEPNHPFSMYYMGSLFLAQKQYDEAIGNFKKTIEIQPEFTPALAGLGQTYLRLNKMDLAIKNYKKAVDLEPENMMHRRQLLGLYTSTQKKELANQQIKEMLYFTPGVKQNYLKKGRELLIIGANEQAIATMNKIIPVYKDIPVAFSIKAAAYSNLGKTTEAEESINDFLLTQRENPLAHHYIGMCYMAMESYKKAEAHFQKVISLNPNFGRSFVPLTIIEQLNGNYLRALEGLNIAKQRGEPEALIEYLSAHIFLQQNNEKVFLIKMKNGAKLISGLNLHTPFSLPRNKSRIEYAKSKNLMILFFLNGWYGKTLEINKDILKINKNDRFALYYKALCEAVQNKNDDAMESYKALLNIDNTIFSAHMGLGDLYLKTNDLENAIQSFEKVIDHHSQFSPAYSSLGDVYSKKNDSKAAIKNYKKAIETNSHAIAVYPKLILLLTEDDATLPEAKRVSLKLESLSPNDPFSLDAMGWVKLKDKKKKEGLALIKNAYQLAPQDPLILYHLGVANYQMKEMKLARKFLQASIDKSNNFSGYVEAKKILKQIDSKD